MTSVIVSKVENNDIIAPQDQNNCSSKYTLQWRRGQLLVKSSLKVKQPYLPSLNDEKLLINCLKRSPVNLVSIDGKLGETWLKFWAEACNQAHKPIFLSKPAHVRLSKSGSQSLNWLWRLINQLVAFGLLLLVIPVMLGLVMLMQIDSPKSLFTYEWRVGERGKFFRLINFCTTTQNNSKTLGLWLKKSGLYQLPQLWNVLRGEMNLTGSDCWTLEDAVKLSLAGQQQANTLPIITRSWEVSTESQLVHLDS
ncbi:heterocyst development glycosyltransferase HepC [Anabaena subtropica]|uniref:Sugar transferase n=1 Tax=Anabaena subtropica FACHB-260 TaxID=2692884 RepID=A0ABR8CHR3_9NOST|nr:heterocyst development glycosyltransferase HepC [Anabaena subtropica]MBD2342594.1 sugar transferase [Anabaena subtropica FACHB-260]